VHLSLNQFAVRDHVGGWVDDDTLVVDYAGGQGGEARRECITIVVGTDRLAGDVVETLGGAVVVTTTLTFVRES
jgi:hypothetical protein